MMTDRDLRTLLSVAQDAAVLGEEHGATAGTAPERWILDPIDGTLIDVDMVGEPVAALRDPRHH